MPYFIGFVIGLVSGALIVFVLNYLQRKQAEASFAVLSHEALRKNTADFLQLANQTLSTQTQIGAGELEAKKTAIDQTLQTIKSDLNKVEKLVGDSENARIKSAAEISTGLKTVSQQTEKLQDTTGKLQAALANTKIRGQWGERMAEDVLRYIGFIEGINYVKQKTQESVATRPDYSIFLPQDLKLNMDVKFPLDSYLKYMAAENEAAKETFKQQFLKDARQRIKEVTTRDYINPAEHTLDYVLVFVPSEQVYCFIHENDKNIMEESIINKVILCSPITLYAILSIIRQQVDNFKLQSTASQVLALMGTFNKQWTEYKKCSDSVATRIQQTLDEFEKLRNTRTKMLDRSLKSIEDLRKEKGIMEAPLLDTGSDDEQLTEKEVSGKN
jgi:DNA recombination protein RmuC